MTVFLDTGLFAATIAPRDPNHDRAEALLRAVTDGAYGRAVTSDYIVDEALTWLRVRVRRRAAEQVLVRLVFGDEHHEPVVDHVLRVHGHVFNAALGLFGERFERGLSFTDCTTIVLMERHRIGHLATFDSGFPGLVSVVP